MLVGNFPSFLEWTKTEGSAGQSFAAPQFKSLTAIVKEKERNVDALYVFIQFLFVWMERKKKKKA